MLPCTACYLCVWDTVSFLLHQYAGHHFAHTSTRETSQPAQRSFFSPASQFAMLACKPTLITTFVFYDFLSLNIVFLFIFHCVAVPLTDFPTKSTCHKIVIKL